MAGSVVPRSSVGRGVGRTGDGVADAVARVHSAPLLGRDGVDPILGEVSSALSRRQLAPVPTIRSLTRGRHAPSITPVAMAHWLPPSAVVGSVSPAARGGGPGPALGKGRAPRLATGRSPTRPIPVPGSAASQREPSGRPGATPDGRHPRRARSRPADPAAPLAVPANPPRPRAPAARRGPVRCGATTRATAAIRGRGGRARDAPGPRASRRGPGGLPSRSAIADPVAGCSDPASPWGRRSGPGAVCPVPSRSSARENSPGGSAPHPRPWRLEAARASPREVRRGQRAARRDPDQGLRAQVRTAGRPVVCDRRSPPGSGPLRGPEGPEGLRQDRLKVPTRPASPLALPRRGPERPGSRPLGPRLAVRGRRVTECRRVGGRYPAARDPLQGLDACLAPRDVRWPVRLGGQRHITRRRHGRCLPGRRDVAPTPLTRPTTAVVGRRVVPRCRRRLPSFAHPCARSPAADVLAQTAKCMRCLTQTVPSTARFWRSGCGVSYATDFQKRIRPLASRRAERWRKPAASGSRRPQQAPLTPSSPRATRAATPLRQSSDRLRKYRRSAERPRCGGGVPNMANAGDHVQRDVCGYGRTSDPSG